MPFTFKLSMRLALMKASPVVVAAAAAVAAGREGRRVTGPTPPNLVQLVTSPNPRIPRFAAIALTDRRICREMSSISTPGRY